jgi:hypothetical protein
MSKRNLKYIGFEVTDELYAAIEYIRGVRKRNPIIEDLLWKTRAVKDAAKALGVERKPRRRPGNQPRTDDTK